MTLSEKLKEIRAERKISRMEAAASIREIFRSRRTFFNFSLRVIGDPPFLKGIIARYSTWGLNPASPPTGVEQGSLQSDTHTLLGNLFC